MNGNKIHMNVEIILKNFLFFMTRTDLEIKTHTIPTQILMNGEPIKFKSGGYIHPILYNSIEHQGGFLEKIPIIGSFLHGLTGLGLLGNDRLDGPLLGPDGYENHGGFIEFLPLIFEGVKALGDLFKGHGLSDYAEHFYAKGIDTELHFLDQNKNILNRTRTKMNNMHKALLADPDFVQELSKSCNSNTCGYGISPSNGSGLPEYSGFYNKHIGSGFGEFQNINKI